MLITDAYQSQMREMHVQREDFGKRGSQWAVIAMAMCGKHETTDVLDYGCGKGELNLHLPFSVKCYDPGVPKHAKPAEPADIVLCTDVLEHIEPECLDDVLKDLRRVTKKEAFLVIALTKAKKILPDGRNAHLIIESPEWWEDQIKTAGFEVISSDCAPLDDATPQGAWIARVK